MTLLNQGALHGMGWWVAAVVAVVTTLAVYASRCEH